MSDQVALVFKAIGRTGPLVNDKQLTRDLQRLNQKMGKRMKRSFQRTTNTWTEPVIFQQITETKPEPAVIVYTVDVIYGYVSGGTAVRYATMTPDFSPKTRPGELDSRPGQGGVLFISLKHPRPGIKARKFPELVEKIHLPEYENEVTLLLARAAARGEV